MYPSLLVTKLYFPPARPTLVRRPRLVGRLQVGLGGPLTLVAAPAGYGKTTLLGEWRAREGAGLPVAWLSLDAGDNDLARFLLYLCAALNSLQPGLVENTPLLLESPQLPPLEVLCTTLLNEISAYPGDLVLGLDDYHAITTTAIHHALVFLLDHLPPHLHLVILTRADPPLPLARLRARNQLVEIRAADLRFTSAEAAEFLTRVMGFKLSPQEIAALETRTEGWIAGLQMAALSMRGRQDLDGFIAAFSGSHQYIVDYLAEEVLDRQPQAVRDFLLKTAILARLNGALCDALTAREDGQAMLEMLSHSDLFLIPLDNERRWFRYHHLFANLLRSRLGQSSAPEEIAVLHQRASLWFETNELLYEALDHALAGGEFHRAARLLGDRFVAIASQHRLPSFIQWMRVIPEAVVCTHPRLCIVKAYVLAAQEQTAQVARYIQLAEQALEQWVDSGELSPQSLEYAEILAEIRGNQAGLAVTRGDYTTARSAADQALALAPDNAYFVRALTLLNLAYAYSEMGRFGEAIATCTRAMPIARSSGHPGVTADSAAYLGAYLQVQGQLRKAFQVQQQALDDAERHHLEKLSIFCPLYYGLADLHYHWNQLEQAEQKVQLGIEVSRSGGRSSETIAGLVQAARIQFARREFKEALATLEQGSVEERKSGIQQHHKTLAYHRARIQAVLGNPAEAFAWANAAASAEASPIGGSLGYSQGRQALARAHLLVACGQVEQALQLLPAFIVVAKAQGSLSWYLEALVIQAVSWQEAANTSKALQSLKEALVLAEPQGYMRLFLDEGDPIHALLETASNQWQDEPIAGYIGNLLAGFRVGSHQAALGEQSLIAPLSPRELEVLGLIAAGRTNKEIASELVIAIGTVKRHTVNIFNKLDVKNRTEAVAKARELALL